jgi:CheY-like chemotaxis protein
MQEILSQYSPGQLTRYKALSIAFALITLSTGAAALLGWILDSEFLKRIHPELVTMKANTSVCLIVISCSFLLLRDPKAASWKRHVGQVCAVLVGLVGLFTLSEHIVGWDLHIDQLLFEESVAAAGLSFPGRMGVPGSLNFFFLGVALPHVFEMFRQADSSNSRRHGGMGIGLALVQELVQLHGGTVAAESQGTNKGSRFTIRLPLTSDNILTSLSASTPLKLTGLAHKDFLIVDDSEDTIAMLAQLLKISGANVTSATNGAEALRLASELEFDLVLSDISMPEMDGYEFLQRLRTIVGRERIPVIAITGFGRPDDIERIRAAGFYSHLTKPLNLDALAAVLDQLANGAAKYQSSNRAPRNNGSPASDV